MRFDGVLQIVKTPSYGAWIYLRTGPDCGLGGSFAHKTKYKPETGDSIVVV